MSEPTIKQWKRRALSAEQELATIHKIRAHEASMELEFARENATLRVALREIQESSNWAHGMIADRLGGV